MLKNKILVFCGFLVLSATSCDTLQRSKELFFNRFRISTPSMSPTLKIGEVYSVISVDTFKTNQIVTYHPPEQYRIGNDKVVWAHRLVGLPGDVIEMKKGVLMVNQKAYPYRITLKHSYLVKTSMPLKESKVENFEYEKLEYNTYTFHSTPEEIALLKANAAVTDVSSSIAEEGDDLNQISLKIVGANRDNWGPVRVPRRGDKVLITENNQEQYELLITAYEHQPNPSVNETYVIQKDYYFVLGDNRHNTLDSRYTGFIPHDEMGGVVVKY